MKEKKNLKKQQTENECGIEEEFHDLMDLEFLEMIELIEMEKKGELTKEQFKKLEYIRKTRENLYGGDA
ncbi:MAG TPA: hypothetical protein PKW56_05895 [Clostridiales bacterium]|nr:hypothetical protein [Clostridiales bacterium]